MAELKPTGKRLKVFDGVGAFDQLVEVTRRLLVGSSGGTAAEVTNSLRFRVLEALVNRLPKDDDSKDHNSSIIVHKETGEASKATTLGGSGDIDRRTGKLKLVLDRNRVSEPEKKKLKKTGNDRKSTNTNNNGRETMSFEDLGLEPPELSRNLERKLREKGGTDIKLVIMKKVFKTDLSGNHDRLTIPVKQIRDRSFLTEEEERFLAGGSEKDGLPVMLMEPCGEESSLVFVKWNLKASDSYALRTSWNKVVLRNHVKEKLFKLNDIIQIWSFRLDQQLWLAIDKVWNAPSSSSLSSSR